MGLYYSISSTQETTYEWLKRQINKIIIPTLLIVVPLRVVKCIQTRTPIYSVLVFLTTVPYWLNHNGDWFVIAIILCIVITPLIYIICKSDSKHTRLIALIMIIAISILGNIVLNIENNVSAYSVVGNAFFILIRVPGFVFGFILGKLIKEDKYVKKHILCGCVLAAIVLNRIPVLHMHVGCLLSLPSIALFCWFFKLTDNTVINEILKKVGGISLESYLLNVYLAPIMSNTDLYTIDRYHFIYYFIVGVLGIILSFMFNKIAKKILFQIQSKIE